MGVFARKITAAITASELIHLFYLFDSRLGNYYRMHPFIREFTCNFIKILCAFFIFQRFISRLIFNYYLWNSWLTKKTSLYVWLWLNIEILLFFLKMSTLFPRIITIKLIGSSFRKILRIFHVFFNSF